MEVNIIKAEEKHFVDCVIALQKSELGRLHFSEENSAAKAINEGISKGEIFVAVTNEDLCVGFIWVVKNGAFHSFPYLHLIAVKEEYRNHVPACSVICREKNTIFGSSCIEFCAAGSK